MSMSSNLFQKDIYENEDIGLSEDFRNSERETAPYFFPLEGIILSGEETLDVLKYLCQSQHPLLHLYIPNKHGEEEVHEFKVQRVENNTLSLLDISRDSTAISFMRKKSTLRFGFELHDNSYIFETRVLGFAQDKGEVLLAEIPERIYRERRRHPRYQLWPEHKAYLEGMQVHDISWHGLRVLSERSLCSGDTLKNVQLTLPLIPHPRTETYLYSGARINVPRIGVRYRISQDICSYYGLYFKEEWDPEQTQKLGDFLLALRKHFFYNFSSQ